MAFRLVKTRGRVPARADTGRIVYMLRRYSWGKDYEFNRALEARLSSRGVRVVWDQRAALPQEFWNSWNQRTRAWPKGLRVFSFRARKAVHALTRPRYAAVLLENKVPGLHRFRVQRDLRKLARSDDVVLVGRSRGAWLATTIADASAVRGVVGIGYPFKNPERGDEPQRYQHLKNLRTPTVIVQGESDEYGGREIVDRYELSPSISVTFIEASHDLRADEPTIGRIADLIVAVFDSRRATPRTV